jgi:hypothetical protein
MEIENALIEAERTTGEKYPTQIEGDAIGYSSAACLSIAVLAKNPAAQSYFKLTGNRGLEMALRWFASNALVFLKPHKNLPHVTLSAWDSGEGRPSASCSRNTQ